MKFTFNANMQKGECHRCPFMQSVGKRWYCPLLDIFVGSESDDCPLKYGAEEGKVVWHPYPKEKPIYGVCLITRHVCWHNGIEEITQPIIGTAFFDSEIEQFVSDTKEFEDDEVIAWAYLPAPYKER